eukprot:TRINITY_DN63948_c0_g1_i1.p1 TRINITY_DN63948_c0_g1~~TRINITY_DN63948_c0_g1_i1.p1  ORF type:complete len:367 (-),score=63.35 TRINITY_DN63948_c0_g1_i1:323-1423(-)
MSIVSAASSVCGQRASAWRLQRKALGFVFGSRRHFSLPVGSSAAATRPQNPKTSWFDFRPNGGLRHSVLEWDGEGPVVLFLHANSLCAGSWSPVVNRLAPSTGLHAFAVDQRGHGDTDAPTDPDSYQWHLFGDDFLRIVAALMERFGRGPDACVTHSFAGDCALIALAAASADGTDSAFASAAKNVGRLILLDPVLADAEGATTGADRLAKGTRRLGEREADGFESAEAVGDGLERLLRASLARDGLHAEAKAAYAAFGSMPDPSGRWRLKCHRDNEAAVYARRIALADHLAAGRHVDADVQLVFSGKRRAKDEDQQAAFERDLCVAERVVGRCRSGDVHRLDGVGHFLSLEAPELVASTVLRLLP